MLGWKNRWAIFHCTKLNQPLEEIYISARFCIFNGKLSYQLWMYFNWQTQTLFLLFVWENAFWYLEESLHLMGFPGGSDSKKSGNSGDGVWSLGGEDPLEKEMATHPNILAWRIHGERSLVGYSPWGCKESDMTGCLTLWLWHLIVNCGQNVAGRPLETAHPVYLQRLPTESGSPPVLLSL